MQRRVVYYTWVRMLGDFEIAMMLFIRYILNRGLGGQGQKMHVPGNASYLAFFIFAVHHLASWLLLVMTELLP